ncbi:MAG TPA: phosphoglycerate kinase, partial [Terrimesophilobacter sp.]|nr:phosphoglycerate kinase [Terrimesophilobacter sp.]
GGLVVLENLRFNAAETSKDASARVAFASQLAKLGDALVSDGFGVVHRKHASVYELAEQLPSAAGRLIETELGVLERLTREPARPYTIVLGGSKVSDKLGVISHLLPKVDNLLIGGGMMFTFIAARGHTVGGSLLELEQLDTVRDYIAEAARIGVNVVLPTDTVVASAFAADAEHTVRAVESIELTPWAAAGIGLDIGPDTASTFAEIIRASGTVFWNGPMGVFEFNDFAHGTRTVAQALVDSGGFTVIGGG